MIILNIAKKLLKDDSLCRSGGVLYLDEEFILARCIPCVFKTQQGIGYNSSHPGGFYANLSEKSIVKLFVDFYCQSCDQSSYDVYNMYGFCTSVDTEFDSLC
jgi:hypothetical protein